MKATKGFGRILVDGLALIVIIAVGFLAANYYDSGEVKVGGTTQAEKLQSIATIVASSHKDVLDVAYVNAGGQPGFLVMVKGSATSSTNAAAQQKGAQEYANALATLLKLTATEVLPTEPAIEYIFIETVANGEMQTYVADAAELKALPSDASDRAWLAKLQVPPPSQGPSAQSSSQSSKSVPSSN